MQEKKNRPVPTPEELKKLSEEEMQLQSALSQNTFSEEPQEIGRAHV